MSQGRETAIDIALGRIAALRWGEPGMPRVLALHGWLDNAASFVPLAPHLPGIDLVAIDLPGHGHSAHLPPGADYSFALAMHNVLDVADALGWEWSSDPRLTLPTMVRMTEEQVRALIAGIECPTRVIYADPPQPYLPEPRRSEHAALLPRGEMIVLSGSHHLHMEHPAEVAAAIGDFFHAAP